DANGNRDGGNAANGQQKMQQAPTDHGGHGQHSGAGGRYGMQATGGGGTAGETGQAVLPIETISGKPYADAEKMAGLIGFQTVYGDDNRTLMIGDHDPVITLTANSTEAVKEENALAMNAP